MTIVVSGGDESVSLVVLDPVNLSILRIEIPSKVRIEASRQMGEWYMESVWRLGESEEFGGEFLSESVQRTFRVPVDRWIKGEVFERRLFDFGVLVEEGNLGVRERIVLCLFNLRVSEGSREKMKLGDFGVLEETVVGGEEAFVFGGARSPDIARIFGIPSVLKEGAYVGVVDSTGGGLAREYVLDLVENMGAKVVSFENGERKSEECVVRGSGVTSKEISRVLRCAWESGDGLGESSVELVLGEGFVTRW
jgi:hypothetical protein